MGIYPPCDLAMLKIEAGGLPAIAWATAQPAVGQWVVAAGMADDPLAVGVVSVPRRTIPPTSGADGRAAQPEGRRGRRSSRSSPTARPRRPASRPVTSSRTSTGSRPRTRPSCMRPVAEVPPRRHRVKLDGQARRPDAGHHGAAREARRRPPRSKQEMVESHGRGRQQAVATIFRRCCSTTRSCARPTAAGRWSI